MLISSVERIFLIFSPRRSPYCRVLRVVAYAERVDRNFSLDIILKGDIRGNCDVTKI